MVWKNPLLPDTPDLPPWDFPALPPFPKGRLAVTGLCLFFLTGW